MNFTQRIYRPTPKLPTQAYNTFRVSSPVATHFRAATCQEFNCSNYNNGWSYIKAELEKENLLYAVTHAGKRYREMSIPVLIKVDDEWITGPEQLSLVFEPGQSCFQERSHVVPLGRPEFYFAGRGDFRSFRPREARRFNHSEDWLDMFQNEQDKIITTIQRG